MLLQIHDELVFEVPENEAEKTEKLVKEAMESVMKLDVPLVVNISVGGNLAKV
jgi:DNA polymerase-1